MTTLIPPVTVDVFGYVYDGNSDPVENATITFQSSNNFFRDGNNYNIDEVVYTDRKGLFQIPLYVTKEGDRALATVQVVIEYTNTQGDDVVDKFDILVANPNDNPNDRSVNIERLIVNKGDVVIFSGPKGSKGDPGGAVGKERFFLARRDGTNPISLGTSWQMIVDVNNLPEGVTLVQEEFDGKMIPAFTGPDSGDPIDDIELVVRVGNETFDTRTLWGFVPWDGDIVAGRAIANDSRLSIEVNNSNEVSLGIDLQGNIFIGSRNSIANAEVLLQGLVYGAGLRGLQGVEGPPGARGKDGGPFFIEGAADITTAEFGNTGSFGYSTAYGESSKPLPGVAQITLLDGGSFRSLSVALLPNVNVKYVYIDGFQYSLNDGGVVIKDGQGARFSFPPDPGVMFRFAMQLEDGTFVPDGARFSPFAERVAEVSQGVEENRKKNLEQDEEIEELKEAVGVTTESAVESLFAGIPEQSEDVFPDDEILINQPNDKINETVDPDRITDAHGDLAGAMPAARPTVDTPPDPGKQNPIVHYAVTSDVDNFTLGDGDVANNGLRDRITSIDKSRVLLAHSLVHDRDFTAALFVRPRTATHQGYVTLLTNDERLPIALEVQRANGSVIRSTKAWSADEGWLNGVRHGGYTFNSPDNDDDFFDFQNLLFGTTGSPKAIKDIRLALRPLEFLSEGAYQQRITLALARRVTLASAGVKKIAGTTLARTIRDVEEESIQPQLNAINNRVRELEADVHPVVLRTIGGNPLITDNFYNILSNNANSATNLDGLADNAAVTIEIAIDVPSDRISEINAITDNFQLNINGQSTTLAHTPISGGNPFKLTFSYTAAAVRGIRDNALGSGGTDGSLDVTLRKGSLLLFREDVIFSSRLGTSGGGGGIPEWDEEVARATPYPSFSYVLRNNVLYVSRRRSDHTRIPGEASGNGYWNRVGVTSVDSQTRSNAGDIVYFSNDNNNLYMALRNVSGIPVIGGNVNWKQLTFTRFTPQFKTASTTLGSGKMTTAELHAAFDRIGFSGLVDKEWYRVTYQIDFYAFGNSLAATLQIRAGARDTGPLVGLDNVIIPPSPARFYISMPFQATSAGILTLGQRDMRPHSVGRIFARAWLEKI